MPNLLQSLQQLSHLNKLEIFLERKTFTSPRPTIEWNIGCKPNELLQSLGQLSCLTTLHITNAFDLLNCAVTFPPNITKLTLRGIDCISDEGMNALENLAKLRILRLLGEGRLSFSGYSFDINCVAGGFPQLQVFHMSDLEVGNWKLGNGAMLRLQSLVIDSCTKLDDLPNELWSLSDLRKVIVKRPSEPMARMLQNLEIKDGVELIVEDY